MAQVAITLSAHLVSEHHSFAYLVCYVVHRTGSGLGTFVLEMLEDIYPEVYRFTTCVFPSKDDDVITSPYNRYGDLYSVLCLVFLHQTFGLSSSLL